MEKIHSSAQGWFILGLVLSLAAFSLAAAPPVRVAKVIRVEGHAQYSLDHGATFHALTPGTVLSSGSMIATAKEKDAYVDVALGDGSTTVPGPTAPPVGPGRAALGAGGGNGRHKAITDQDIVRLIGSEEGSTILTFEKLNATETGDVMVTETELGLKHGHIVGNVKKMSAGSTYNIRYANGLVGIRGSVFDLALVEGLVDGKVKVNVVLNMQTGSAVVNFQNDQGMTISQVVLPLQSLNTGTGVLGPIPPSVLVAILNVLEQMGVPPVLATRIVTSNQTTVQFLTNTGNGG